MLQIVASEPTKISVVLKQRNTGQKTKVELWAEAGERYVKRFIMLPLAEGEDGEERGDEVPAATALDGSKIPQ